MKKHFKIFCWISSFLFFATNIYASHVVGSDITYRCLGSSKYEITVSLYRDCNGISLAATQVYKTSCNTSTWTRTDTLNWISVRDITGINPTCTTKSLCNGSYTYGFEEYVLKDTLDLSGVSCTEFTISWEECCRNGSISTGAANYNFYTEAVIYNYPGVCNSSPLYTTPATALLCVNAVYQFNNGALDTLDGDSLSFKLVEPLQAKNTTIAYSGSWSAVRPVTFLGFPNQTLPLPAGFHFDQTTGNLEFRPTITNQVSIIVLEVTEWREVNDTMRIIGKTRRDMQFVVINCGGNRNPSIAGSSKTTCPNEQVCISITTSDQDGDSVKLSWNHGIPNATYASSGGTILMDTARICWTPTEADITNIPYNFTVTAKDNNCPVEGKSVKAFSIFVYEPPKATSKVISLGCGHVDVDYTPNKNYTDLTQTWIVRDSTGQQVYTSIRKQDTLLVPKGTVYITLMLKALGNCITTYTDTLQIPEHVEVHLQSDTFACQNKQIQVNSTTKDGMAPFHYVWNTSLNDTLTTLTLDTAKGNKYWITVTDAIGCTWWDTVRVRWDTVPKPLFTTTPLCYNVPVNFINTTTAAQVGSFSSLWNFGDTGNMDTSSLKSPAYTYFTEDTFSVKLKVISNKGCTDSIISDIIIRPKPSAAFAVNDTGQCLKENRFEFTNQSTVSYGSLGYKWFFGNGDTSATENPIAIYNVDSSLYMAKLLVTSNYQCKDSAFANLAVFPDPIAAFTVNDSQQCVNANNFVFTNSSALKQGTMSYRWYFGDGDTSVATSPSHIYNQHDTLFANLIAISDKGCRDTASRKLVIWPKPIAGFTVNDSSQCLDGNDFSFTNISTIPYNGGLSYYWEAGDGYTVSGLNFQRTYSSDINYWVKLRATSLNGCIDSFGKWVYVRPQPVPGFTINDSTQCVNANTYILNNTSTVKYGTMGYNWDFADGTNSVQANPTKVFTKDSTFRVTLWATTNYGCVDSAGKYAVVYPKPNPNFTINDSEQCVNTDLFVFTNASAIKSGTMSHRWYFGNGDSLTSLNASYGYSIDSIYKIKLLSVSNFNCSDTFVKAIRVFPKPSANFIINDDGQCLNTNLFSFTSLSTIKQGGLEYYWDFGNGKTALSKDTFIVYSKDSTYTITLIPRSDELCYDTLSKQVTVYPVPKVNFAANDSDQCLNTNNFIFNNFSTIKYGTMSYEWDFNGLANSIAVNPSYIFTKDTFYTIQLKVISDKSCTDSLSKVITVHPLPKVSFTINDTAQCENTDAFSFTNTSVIKYGTIQYVWFFGDGDSLDNQHVNHGYVDDGIYTINLKAISNYNCIDSGRKQVWVIPKPQSLFSVDDSSKCENPGIFTFTAQSTIKYSTSLNYQWDFGNSIVSKASDTAVKYSANGNYNPTLITGTGDNCYDTVTRTVLVYPKPNPDFSIDADSQCIHINNFSFTNTSTIDSGIMSHTWQYGDGGTSTTPNGQHVYSLDTVFSVWLKSTSVFGCSDSISRQVVVMSKPIINFTINDSGQCINDNLFIFKNTSAIKAGTLDFNWDFGNGMACNCTDTSVNYNYDSTFRVVLYASSEFGCDDTIGKYIIVHSKPNPSYLVNDTDQCLETQQFDFTGYGAIKSGFFNSNWYFSDGQTATSLNPSIKFNNPGTYQVKFLLTSNHNCKDSVTGQVIVYPHPNPDFTGLRRYYCTDYPVVSLTPVVPGGIFGGKNMAGDQYTPNFAGSDTVTYTVTVNGCSNDTVKFTTVYPLPVLELGLDTTLCRKEVIFLDASFPNSTYVWQDGSRTPTYRVWQPGRYIVTMYNVCDTLTDEITVSFRDYDCNFFFPTAFTPNNDGINDVFLPYFESDVLEMNLKVFDRWGQLVFGSDDLTKGWTGVFNGEALPQDVYIWTVDLKILEKDFLYKHSASGNVTLLR